MQREAARGGEDQVGLQQHLRHETEVRNGRDNASPDACARQAYIDGMTLRAAIRGGREMRGVRIARRCQRFACERMAAAHETHEAVGEEIAARKTRLGILPVADDKIEIALIERSEERR